MHSPTTTSGPTPRPADDAPAGWRGHRARHRSGAVSSNTTRDGVGGAGDLGLEQLRQGGRRHRPRGVVPRAQDGVPLGRGQDVEAADRPVRLPQPPPPAAAPAGPPSPPRWHDRTGRWRIRCAPSSPSGRAVALRAARPRLTERSNLALAVATGSRAAPRPGSSSAGSGIVLQRQHDLEQRMARQRARRVEHLDQALERQILMAIGGEIGASARGRSGRASSGCQRCRCAAPGC